VQGLVDVKQIEKVVLQYLATKKPEYALGIVVIGGLIGAAKIA